MSLQRLVVISIKVASPVSQIPFVTLRSHKCKRHLYKYPSASGERTSSYYVLPNLTMSLQTTPSPTYTELPAQAFLAREVNRPALGALNGLLSSFPVIKIFTSNAVPLMVYREQQNAK